MAKSNTNTIKLLSDKQMAKKYKGYGKASVIAITPEKTLRIPSRSIAITHQLNGGVVYGKILELFGEESTGKSLLATDFCYTTQALGGVVIWADAENAFDADWMVQNGLDLTRIELLTPENAIEVISDWIKDVVLATRARLTNNEPILVVLDSTAALDCLDNINSSQVDARAEMGNRAKAIYKFLRIRNGFFDTYGASVILINQLRRKVGASKFEDPDTTPGGAASKFYASQRVGLVRGKAIKIKERGIEKKVGQNIYVRTKKDKTGPPRNTTPTQVFFMDSEKGPVGFSKYYGLSELLVELEVLTRKKGSSRYYLGEKFIMNGEEKMQELLESDHELRKKLIRKSGINTISKTRKAIESIETNLFPVILGKNAADSEEA